MENSKEPTRSKRFRYWRRVCIGIVLGLALLAALMGYHYFRHDLALLNTWAKGLDGIWVLLILTILPLFGCPVSFLYALAGAKFGSIWGIVWVAVSIAVDLLAFYWLTTSFFHKPIAAIFAKTKYRMPRIPKGEDGPVCLLTALVPGIPFSAKNYLLVLAGASLRPYFWISLPINIINGSLPILFGDFTKNMNTAKLAFLIGYGLLLTFLSRYVYKRLRAKREGCQSQREAVPSPSVQ